MPISDLLMLEFNEEAKKTRATLERVPMDKPEFVPHPKSMPMGKLAAHVVGLARFGVTVLTTPQFDFSGGQPQPSYETNAQLLKAFDENAGKMREALKTANENSWTEDWKLSFKGAPIFTGKRFLAYRQMFLNHLVHHRAQLGVYLRLNEQPLPATYGPSADDKMGF